LRTNLTDFDGNHTVAYVHVYVHRYLLQTLPVQQPKAIDNDIFQLPLSPRQFCSWMAFQLWGFSNRTGLPRGKFDKMPQTVQAYQINPKGLSRYLVIYFIESWSGTETIELEDGLNQGCDICLCTWYQNRKNAPNEHKMHQLVLKYP
jgi:hypothetical protein